MSRQAKLDFGNVLQRVAPVLNPKRVRCVAMSLLTFLVCCSSENVSAWAWQFDFIPWLIAAIMQTSKLRSLANTHTHTYTHSYTFTHAKLMPGLHYQSTRASIEH